MAQDGLARAIRPVHSPLDGDTVFVLATGARPLADPVFDLGRIGAAAADCLAPSARRGVFKAARWGGWSAIATHGRPDGVFARPGPGC